MAVVWTSNRAAVPTHVVVVVVGFWTLLSMFILLLNRFPATSQVLSERESLELLEHISRCPCSLCQYPNCLELKRAYRHALLCKVRAHRGCLVCKKLWGLVGLHARACKESECRVLQCKNMKEHLRKKASTAPSDFLNEGFNNLNIK